MPVDDAQLKSDRDRGVGPIVSSSHLADGAMPSLSEMEFSLIVAHNAFARWTARCMDATGLSGLSPLEVQVLHQANHRDREKTLGDMCTVLNVEDTHLVTYAIKKLQKLGLVSSGKRGKEKTITITENGRSACSQYREVREALLVSSVIEMGLSAEEVSRIARLLRGLSGQYDAATRGAASL